MWRVNQDETPCCLILIDAPQLPVRAGAGVLGRRRESFQGQGRECLFPLQCPSCRLQAVIRTFIPNARVIRMTVARVGLPSSDNALYS